MWRSSAKRLSSVLLPPQAKFLHPVNAISSPHLFRSPAAGVSTSVELMKLELDVLKAEGVTDDVIGISPKLGSGKDLDGNLKHKAEEVTSAHFDRGLCRHLDGNLKQKTEEVM